MKRMISVRQAEVIIRGHTKTFPRVRVPLEGATGRVLSEDLFADRDLPAFFRATMDGIAVSFQSWRRGRRGFPITGLQKAGASQKVLKNKNACIEIMTGAMLPKGSDCVIPVEELKVLGKMAYVREGFRAARGLNVHPKGSDCRKGRRLLQKGCRLTPPQIAVAAAVGKDKIYVAGMPRIAVVDTGDELVPVGRKTLKPFEIRRSNVASLQSLLNLHGYTDIESLHLRDNPGEMRRRLRKLLKTSDVLVLSGGVSAGKFDFVPRVLKELRVRVLFSQVRQKPGRPMWFGVAPGGTPVFALPGNPVSTQVCARRYVLPYLAHACGLNGSAPEYASLNKDVRLKTTLTYFLPVKLQPARDGRRAQPVFFNSSGDFASLAHTDGFLEFSTPKHTFRKNSLQRFYPWVS